MKVHYIEGLCIGKPPRDKQCCGVHLSHFIHKDRGATVQGWQCLKCKMTWFTHWTVKNKEVCDE